MQFQKSKKCFILNGLDDADIIDDKSMVICVINDRQSSSREEIEEVSDSLQLFILHQFRIIFSFIGNFR